MCETCSLKVKIAIGSIIALLVIIAIIPLAIRLSTQNAEEHGKCNNLFVTSKNEFLQFSNSRISKCCMKAKEPFKPLF